MRRLLPGFYRKSVDEGRAGVDALTRVESLEQGLILEGGQILRDSDMFNPSGMPTAKFQVGCAAGQPWTMAVEWLGSYFEDLDPDEILTIEYVISRETPETPYVNVIAADFVEVGLNSAWDSFRVLDSNGDELAL